MQLIKITPRGYCHGVVTALNIVTKASTDPSLPQPIYILGQIVHNQHLTDAFSERKIITLDQTGKTRAELLDSIETGTVIFTAHGVSPAARKKAQDKGLHIIDAVCSDVKRTHELISQAIADDHYIIYIGKKGHPEPEGAVGIAPDRVLLVETIEDVHSLPLDTATTKILITNQTTLSIWDVAKVATAIEKKYPHATFIKEICLATQTRQEAVIAAAPYVDIIIVIGDPKSNNTNRLVQIAQESGVEAYRIENITQINPLWLKDKQTVGVTSGASTPTALTADSIRYLTQFDYHDITTWHVDESFTGRDLIPKIRSKHS